MDRAFRRRRDRIEADQRAGRHDDAAAVRLGEVDQVRPRQQRAAAQHHHLLAGFEHRPADAFEQRGRRAFDREVGVRRQVFERHDRARDALRARARPAPWRRRAPRRTTVPARRCRPRGGAQARGRSHRGRQWRREWTWVSLRELRRSWRMIPKVARRKSCKQEARRRDKTRLDPAPQAPSVRAKSEDQGDHDAQDNNGGPGRPGGAVGRGARRRTGRRGRSPW